MKRVLVLAYYFPPLGGAGVQRTLKFVKHLHDLGYGSTVVTGPDTVGVDWAPPDPSLMREIPATVRVLRSEGDPPPPRTRDRLARWLAQPSPFERWWQREAARLGTRAIDEVDLVYASMSPFGTAAVASELAGKADKPWVADLRDPWALDEWTVYPSALHRRLDKRRMRRGLRGASAVIVNTPESANALLEAFPEFKRTPVVAVPNGWDRDDFVADAPVRKDGRFRIVYTGYSHLVAGRRHRSRRFLRQALGGAVDGLDVLARSHVFLLEALERLRSLDPELARRVELHVAGPARAEDGSESGTVTVRNHGYLEHDEAVALMRSADLLFLPMHDLPIAMRSRTIPGKTYEYLASGRPILAALPDGDARDLLSGLSNVWLCRPTDVDCMTKALRDIARADELPRAPAELIDRFERRRLAEKLARVFDDALGRTART